MGSGSSVCAARCSAEEYLVANGEADAGSGLRLNEAVEVDEAVEKVLDLLAVARLCDGLFCECECRRCSSTRAGAGTAGS